MPAKKNPYKSKSSSKPNSVVQTLCLTLGMVTAIVGGVMIYRAFNPPPVLETELKTPASDPSNQSAGQDDTTTDVNSTEVSEEIKKLTDYEWLIAEGSDNQVADYLKLLKKWPEGTRSPAILEFQTRRIELATELIRREPSINHMRTAVLAKIKSYGVIYGMTVLDEELRDDSLTSKYRDYAKSFVDDSDEEVRIEAQMALAKVDCCEYIVDQTEEGIATIETDFARLYEHFPDNITVGEMSFLLFVEIARRDKELGVKLMNQASEMYAKSSNSRVKRMAQQFQDESLLTESPIRKLFKERYVLGVESQKSVYDETNKLIKDPRLGRTGIRMVAETMNWFEQMARKQVVLNLSENLQRQAKDMAPETQELALQVAKAFQTRQALRGRKFPFELTKIDGKPVDSDFYKDRPCIAIFVRPSEKNSIKLIRNIIRRRKMLEKSSTRILFIVAKNFDLEEEVPEVIQNLKIDFVQGSAPDSSGVSPLDRHPITYYPTITLLDHKGLVYRVNVTQDKIQFETEFLASQQYRGSTDHWDAESVGEGIVIDDEDSDQAPATDQDSGTAPQEGGSGDGSASGKR